MKLGWLDKAGPYAVEKIPCPDYAGNVDLDAPAKGILHTTEGGWDGSLGVFKQHYAPHFLVGAGRIAQLLPLGRAAAALEHPAGTPPTNGVCRAQIEIVGNSSVAPWLPDAATLDALAHLMAELKAAADIPLAHVPVARDAAAFAKASGWMGHIDVPNNSHWDPGTLEWDLLMPKALGFFGNSEGLRGRTGYYAWLAWYLGEGDWKSYGPRNPRVRPNVPRVISAAWWARERVHVARRSV